MVRRPTYTLRVGELVGRTFAIWFRNLIPFTVLALLILSPWIVAMHFVGEGDDPLRMRMIDILLFVLQTLLTFVLTAAVTFGVVQQMRGQPSSIGASIARGLRSFVAVLGTSLLCSVRIAIGYILLVVPGIIEAIRLYAAIPAAVLEGKTGNAAIDRSARLTTGSRWPIFGSWLLMFVISLGLGMLGGFVFGTMAFESPFAWVWLQVGIVVFTSTLSAAMMAVCYALLRQGKENVDVKQLAAVFD